MNESTFWILIEEVRGFAGHPADVPVALVEKLSQMSAEEIVAYEVIFRRLMDAAYDRYLWLAAGVICGSCGDDGFAYFRGWLIAQGRKVFEAALANPDSLASLQNFHGNDDLPELEEMLYAGRFAFRKKTGQDTLEGQLPSYTKPKLRRSDIWDGQTSSVSLLLPNLVQRFQVS